MRDARGARGLTITEQLLLSLRLSEWPSALSPTLSSGCGAQTRESDQKGAQPPGCLLLAVCPSLLPSTCPPPSPATAALPWTSTGAAPRRDQASDEGTLCRSPADPG